MLDDFSLVEPPSGGVPDLVVDGPGAARGFSHESAVNESFEWYTPKEVFDALGLEFDLDPCSPGAGKSFVPARLHYTIEDNGLLAPWPVDALAWVNPPYGQITQHFVRKLATHPGGGIALLFSRTDTQWFHQYATDADLICFVEARIRFFKGNLEDRGGSPGAGSMLLAYGDVAAEAVLNSGLGACMRFVPTSQSRRIEHQLDLFAQSA